MDREAESIVAEIRAAFQGTARGAITLHEAEVFDGHGDETERALARSRDTESSRDRVPDEHIAECSAALSHLDPQGFHFYLPAYLIWTLRHFHTSDSCSLDFTVGSLDLSGGSQELRHYELERFRRLSAAQGAVVARFLRHVAKDEYFAEQAGKALESYWGRFANPGETP